MRDQTGGDVHKGAFNFDESKYHFLIASMQEYNLLYYERPGTW